MIPGFGDFIDNKRATGVVIKHIETQFDNMLDEECKIQRSKKSRDSRIHAALYFIRPTGKGLRELDIHCLKLLSERCNVIPIISKADLMTADECRLNKRLILRDIRNHGIKIYDFTMCFEDLEDEFFPGRLSEIVPFAVVSGTDRMIIDKEEFKVRKLPHGVVRVDDPTHNDFLILRTCLLGASLQDLKETTHSTYYERYRTEKLTNTTMQDLLGDSPSKFDRTNVSSTLMDRLRNNIDSRQSSIMSAERYINSKSKVNI
ncbi:unnamed protein product [Ambrosiozyma monospora]|uniref:Unnamed protein product n=1 Tax=Ambrosiozyma monospora TaxID=43982 RepID=A0ACB5T5D3_AMBMO|nr:unnamed protein product [Ambrosiozyma monospora]